MNKKPKVYYSIYLTSEEKYINKVIETQEMPRKSMKKEIAEQIFKDVLELF